MHGSGVTKSLKSPSTRTCFPYIDPSSKPLRLKLHLDVTLAASKRCGWKIFRGNGHLNPGGAGGGGNVTASGRWKRAREPCFSLCTEAALEESIISLHISPDHVHVLVVYTPCAEGPSPEDRVPFCAADQERNRVRAECHSYSHLRWQSPSSLPPFFFCWRNK